MIPVPNVGEYAFVGNDRGQGEHWIVQRREFLYTPVRVIVDLHCTPQKAQQRFHLHIRRAIEVWVARRHNCGMTISFPIYFKKSVEKRQQDLRDDLMQVISEQSEVAPEEIELTWDVEPTLTSWDPSTSTGTASVTMEWEAVAGGSWRDDGADIDINGTVTATFKVTHPGSGWLDFDLETAEVHNDL